MTANADRFERDLMLEWQRVQNAGIFKPFRVAALKALEVAVKRSRVDTGTMRNNWQVSLTPDAPVTTLKTGHQGDPPGMSQMMQGDAVSAQAAGTLRVYVLNPLDYPPFVDARWPMLAPALAAAQAVIAKAGSGGSAEVW